MAITDYVYTPGIETWEATGPGKTWVWVMDKRANAYVKEQVGGGDGGSKILRITIDDRRYNELLVVDECSHLNPFRNGSLRLKSTDGVDPDYVSDIDNTYHLSDVELRDFFVVKDLDLFAATLEEIDSELILRRLMELATTDASMAQYGVLRELVLKRYSKSKTQEVLRKEFEDD